MVTPVLSLYADDTEIYGSGSISVEPNILIIFDTSGSMSREDVPGEYYDPGTTYSGTYTSKSVYQREKSYVCKRYRRGRCRRGYWQTNTVIFADSVEDLNCTAIKNLLDSDGTTDGAILDESGGYACGGTKKALFMGNWLNYDEGSTGEMRSRTDVAKEVITNLIQNTDGVRFGLMRFNSTQGGRIVKEIDSVTGDETFRNELITAVNNLPASGYTPLAETLAEAGLYYAGKESWFNNAGDYSDDILTSSDIYSSPMQYRCQKNYIILMTDGEPTRDNDSKLKTGTYINGDNIGDYDQDGNSKDSTSYDGSDYLDDVAKYLYDNDCNTGLGTGDLSFETQNIITYTIGFQSDQQLLQDTAINGGGEYYTASSISGLSEAFETIISKIMEVNAVFVSPVVPVSRMNRTFAGDSLYVGFFKPQQDGRWAGNVKKYGLNSRGDILSASGVLATNTDGSVKENAQSYWSTAPDGPDVTKGGVGGLLQDNSNRNLYTYLGSQTALNHADNAFSTSNSNLTNTHLGVTADSEKERVINDIIGSASNWKMGDVLHSQPIVVHYDIDNNGTDDESYIFVGTNGGILHTFKDSDGSESWGYIPPQQLSRLQLLSDNTTTHDYYIDAAPVMYDSGSAKTLLFGERRGGYNYYALDITSPSDPIYKYTIDQNLLATIDFDNDGSADGTTANLGQSWVTPTVHKIKTGISTTLYDDVLLLAGGYDTNQDLDVPAAVDTVGKSVFAVDVTDGTVSSLNFNAAISSGMNNCIVDVMGFDSNGDSYTNRVYAGDLAGNIWAFEDDDSAPADTSIGGDGNWSMREFFSAGAIDGVQRKIFYSPDVVAEYGGEDMVFFGTGDRADPEETGVVNRIYAIRNNWEHPSTFQTLTEDDLVNVTDNLIQLGDEAEKEAVRSALENKRGWYFELEDSGEKIISSVIVYDKVLYFTTYTPESSSSSSSSDPCATITGRGVARFYAVDYLTGGAVKNYNLTEETDGEGETVEFGKLDRSKTIGTSIASAPVIAVLPGGPFIYIGVEGGIEKENPITSLSMHPFY
jgi:type IV pilus assembly protein PilY1